MELDVGVVNRRCRLLSETPITDLKSLAAAIQVLHKTYRVPHVIITSLRLTRDNQTVPSRPVSKPGTGTHTPLEGQSTDAAAPTCMPQAAPAQNPDDDDDDDIQNLTIIGSTATSDYTPRLFRIDTPQLPLFFSGTGDMFAALTIPRLIEAVHAASTPDANVAATPSWRSPDSVPPTQLPLAKACQKVLASMQAVLAKTTPSCLRKMADYDERAAAATTTTTPSDASPEARRDADKKRHLALMNASEVAVVRYASDLQDPPNVDRFAPQEVREGGGFGA